MAMLKVVGGDYSGGFTKSAYLGYGTLQIDGTTYRKGMIRQVEVVTEENKARVGLLLATGGLGLLAGPRKEITALVTFSDGKRLMVTVKPDHYKELVAMSL